MDWLGPAARWLRELLMRQAWLEAWAPAIARTPDWALVVAGPGFGLLLALLLFVQAPRLTREPAKTRVAKAKTAPALANTNEAPNAPAAAPPQRRSAERQDIPLTHAPAPALNSRGSSEAPAAPSSGARVRRASGVPEPNEHERKARVFLSSTFLDMRGEREVLATKTFPSLRRKFHALGVEVQEVDLRWGVNPGEATMELCLGAVRRCNWFVGLIGQRYGTALKDAATFAMLADAYPSAREGLGKSLTEIEILEGVLLNASGDKQVLFFERDPAWLDTLSASQRAQYEEHDPGAQAKLADLKTRIQALTGPMHVYASPAEIDGAFEQAIAEALVKVFPPMEGANDPFMRVHYLHAAYARERLGLYIGAGSYFDDLNAWMDEDGSAPKLVVGESGAGKSALIANWLQSWRSDHRKDIIFAHYLGASPNSANPRALVRRLWAHLNAATGEEIAPPNADVTLEQLRDALFDRLALAGAFAVRDNCRIVLALDGLDKLAEEHRDLRWWPPALPSRVKLVVSSLEGKSRDAGVERGWSELPVRPFDATQQGEFIAGTLRGWNKSDLTPERKRRVLAHALAGLPLFLKTMLEELRVSAANNILDQRLDDYLKAPDMPGLFKRILLEIGSECGNDFVARALSLIWAGRAGIEEDEIVAITGATRLAWERLRNRLGDHLRDQQGRVAFSHDYLRYAVETAYLQNTELKRGAHLAIADRFSEREADERQTEELPYQLRAAAELGEDQAWSRLEALLVEVERLELLRARGDGELYNYWRPLQGRGVNIEAALCKAFEVRTQGFENWDPISVNAQPQAMAFFHYARINGSSAQRLGEAYLKLCESTLSPDHRDSLAAMNNLAGLLSDRGDHAEAKALLERVLERQNKALGPDSEAALISASNLASIYASLRDLPKARGLQEHVLQARIARLGEAHIQTMTTMLNLANTCSWQGDHEASAGLMRRLYAIAPSVLGGDHSIVLSAAEKLAFVLAEAGDHAGGLALCEKVRAARTRILGPWHADTIRSATNLAIILAGADKTIEAKEVATATLRGALERLGERDNTTITVMECLAQILMQREELAGAEALLTRALQLRTELFGANTAQAMTCAGGLAWTLLHQGKLDEAIELQEIRLEALTGMHGPHHLDTLKCMKEYAEALDAKRDLPAAKAMFERLEAIQSEVLGPEHLDTLATTDSLAGTLYAMGDLAGAETRSQRVVAARTALLGSEHPATQQAKAHLSAVQAALRNRG